MGRCFADHLEPAVVARAESAQHRWVQTSEAYDILGRQPDAPASHPGWAYGR